MKSPQLLVALSSLLVATVAPAEVLERVVVTVNSDIVTLSEFEQRQVAALQAARVGSEGVERYLRENNKRILQEAIDDVLLVQRAHDLGARVPPDYLEQVLDGIKKDNGIANDEQFQEQLKREGMTLDELKRNIMHSVLRRQVLSRELQPKMAVSDADALAEYEAHKADYRRPASVKLQEILVQGDGAEAHARELVAQARAGADFSELARKNSAAASAKSGGDLGTIARGELARELEQSAFALDAGAVSEPIPSGSGFRVLKAVEKNEAGLVPFDKAKPEIAKRLSDQRMAAEYEKYLQGLRKAAVTIDVRVREVPLQVTLPEEGSTLTPKAAPAGTIGEDEFSTSPQSKPERVQPAGPPEQPTPPQG
jgi:parvulin-like peptidyl-prolyl isomerase